MILPTDTRPESSLYFLGAKVLGVLKELPKNKGSFINVYNLVRSEITFSLKLYQLTLDWLYLINVVIVNERGEVCLVHQ
ncbi:ABC-three component system middle component 6 [Liquorilactobacillus hordei]|uniref:ABC-three component system middle component 6 n=1 Tax=Liquorilactobacillus hordei TaxID=468911 RepID=UPI0039EA8F09